MKLETLPFFFTGGSSPSGECSKLDVLLIKIILTIKCFSDAIRIKHDIILPPQLSISGF